MGADAASGIWWAPSRHAVATSNQAQGPPTVPLQKLRARSPARRYGSTTCSPLTALGAKQESRGVWSGMTPSDFLKAIARRVLLLGDGGPAGAHVTRYSMYLQLGALMESVPKQGRVLSISESGKLCDALGLGGLPTDEANFPEHNMLALNFPDASYDFVVSDQVLEHVLGDPFLAVRESFRVLKPGGYAIHTTCLINPIHKYPVRPVAVHAGRAGTALQGRGRGDRGRGLGEPVGLVRGGDGAPVPAGAAQPEERAAPDRDEEQCAVAGVDVGGGKEAPMNAA